MHNFKCVKEELYYDWWSNYEMTLILGSIFVIAFITEIYDIIYLLKVSCYDMDYIWCGKFYKRY